MRHHELAFNKVEDGTTGARKVSAIRHVTESPRPAVTRESPGPQLPSPKQVPEIFPSQGLHLMSPQLSPVPVRRRARETEDHPGGGGL